MVTKNPSPVLATCIALVCSACAVPGVGSERGDKKLTFAELGGWTYSLGLQGMPARIERLSGTRVEMVGFLVPVDGLEASLVSSLGRFRPCEGPEIHEIVHVTLPRKLPRMDRPFRARIRGRFTVGETVVDGYIVDIYQLRADELTLIDSDEAVEEAAQRRAGAGGVANRRSS